MILNMKSYTQTQKINKARFYLSILFILITLSSCHVGRFVVWNFADVKDHEKFPADTIYNGNNSFEFIKTNKKLIASVPEKYNKKRLDLDSFLKTNKTLALLIIRNDTMLYEKYFSDFKESNIHPSFSVSKAFVSALTGIAIKEGYFKSTNQPITDFLPELKDTNFRKVRIEDLLNMRAGLKYTELYANPFGKVAKYYYGNNLKKYTYDVKIKVEPDLRYEYQSVNAQLLSFAIEKATGKTTGRYLQEKIWEPLGMEYYASWNYDSEKNKNTKAFCCLNARARDFAKFGRLYLNKGDWNGKQIISEEWIKRSTSVINNSFDSQGYHYTYMWRVMDSGAFFAKGLLGQYIWVYPDKNLVIVRFGKSYAGIDWAEFFQELSMQL